jgi:hypothetical protein
LPLKRLVFLLFAIFSLTVSAQTTGLSFRPNGAVYSSALDRIIFISGNPSQVHIYDPVGHADQTVTLPEAPANLSLSADGLYAAVTLVDSVSYVNLQSASLVQTFTSVPVNGGVAILGAGYIYVFPSYEGSTTIIQISNGQVSTSSGFEYASGGVFNPAVNAIYSTENGISPNNIYRYNVSGGTVGNATGSPYFAVFDMCGPLWLSPDNSKIYTACGSVFTSSSDTTKDMRYQGILGSLTSIQNLASSAALNQIAAIPAANSYNSTLTADTQVDLFDSAYYNPMGVFQTNPFTVGGSTYAAHGRWVFYNSSSSKMFVVTQADSTAGLEMDYAIDTINLQNSNSCNATFAATSASAIAPGSYATTQILSGEDCAFTAASSVPWITLTSGYYGSGNTALNYLVRPNLTGSARSGTISMGSQSFSVTQSAAGSASSVNPLSINPVAADYSKGLDKIVMVTSSPNELHIYDPVSLADQIVPLSAAPLSVSVEPDGLFAAVGHHGFLSYVDLSAGSVSKTISIDMDIGGILLAGNGYAYAFPSQTYTFTNWNSVQISTGTLSPLEDLYDGNTPRLYPGGGYIYVSGNGSSKYNISAGPATQVTGTNFSGPSGNIWLSEDGVRLIDSTGRAFFTSSIASQDLQPAGSLSGTNNVAWAANSQVHHQTAVLTGTSSCCSAATNSLLQIYNDNGLQLQSQQAMPEFTVGGTSYISHGQYLFWNNAETQLFAVTQADSTAGLLSSFAVNTIAAPESIPACTYSVSPGTIYVPAAQPNYSNLAWSISVSSSCNWSPEPGNSAWLFVQSGTSSTAGSGSATFTVSNNTGGQRSQSIAIGNQVVTVIQAASTCTYALSDTQAVLPTGGGSATIDLVTQSSCPWSIQSGASWLTASSQSGTGPASIQIAATASTSSRSATLNIAGTGVSVLQEQVYSSSPLNFVPVTPCRVADTRNASGAFGGPFIASGSTRSFIIPSSACNIPTTAAAYSLNVAVVPYGALGYLTAFAAGQGQPFVSTLNSPDGRIKSTAAIVPAGTGGAASFYATNDTDLVLDINGYFAPSSANTGLNYYVLNPCRVADTRNADSALGGPFLTASQQRDMPVQQSACNVPSDAQAYSVNLAVVPLAGGLGYLTTWPVGEAQPTVASLNAPTGTVTSNAALLPAGTGGDISLIASNNTQAIIDINGYFAPASSAGLHLYTVQPCRVLDTRNVGTEQPFTGALTVMVGGLCNIPSDASAVVVNATVVPTGPLGYLTLWADGQTQPTVATLNASDGAITSNMAIVPMVDGAIDAFASNPTHLVVDVSGYFAP